MRDVICKGLGVEIGCADVKNSMPPSALSEDGVEGAVDEFLSGGQQKDGQAFTASERHKVSGIRCRGSSQKGRHLGREK